MKIRLAVTDSINGITYQPAERPGVSNLLAIVSYLDEQGRSSEELANIYRELSMRELKDEVVRAIDRTLIGIRERYDHLLENGQTNHLDDVAKRGAAGAKHMTGSTLSTVRQVVGLS